MFLDRKIQQPVFCTTIEKLENLCKLMRNSADIPSISSDSTYFKFGQS